MVIGTRIYRITKSWRVFVMGIRKVLVIAPHPDDETLGCGGTLLKHRDSGDELYWLIITTAKDVEKWGYEKIKKREKEIEKVSEIYNFKEVINLELETTKLQEYSFNLIVEKVNQVLNTIKPSILYVNNRSDIHTDHRIVFDATMSATKTFKTPFIEYIFMYETLSETNFTPPLIYNAFLPNFYTDISNYLEEKINIMKIYESEMGIHPFPRSEDSIRSLAILRGSEANFKYAEGFMLLRGLWR